MEGGPPMFRQDFTCPALLKAFKLCYRVRGCHPLWPLSRFVPVIAQNTGLVRVRSPLLAESRLMSFPPGTEMFQFPGSLPLRNSGDPSDERRVGFPIRTSTDHSLFAAPHGFSQRTTSFIASRCQGIHQMLLRHLITLIIDAHPAREHPRLAAGTMLYLFGYERLFLDQDIPPDQEPLDAERSR